MSSRDIEIEYFEYLQRITETTDIVEQLSIYRVCAHLEALIKIDKQIQIYIDEFPEKLLNNPLLTIEKYNQQCQWFVTPFFFQPPLWPSKTIIERDIYNQLFKDWKPNEFCMIFYKKLKFALGITNE